MARDLIHSNDDDALIGGGQFGNEPGQGRLATATAARDEHRYPGLHDDLEHVEHGLAETPPLQQFVKAKGRVRRLFDGHAGPADRHRRDDNRHIVPVGKPFHGPRAPFAHGFAPVVDQQVVGPVDDRLLVGKTDVDVSQLALALDIDLFWSIDHDLGNTVVCHQRCHRPCDLFHCATSWSLCPETCFLTGLGWLICLYCSREDVPPQRPDR